MSIEITTGAWIVIAAYFAFNIFWAGRFYEHENNATVRKVGAVLICLFGAVIYLSVWLPMRIKARRLKDELRQQ